MKTKQILSLMVLLTLSFNVSGQANLLNSRVPQEVGKLNEQQKAANDEEPLAYGFIDDRDVLWSKTIWETIDLDERINFPYYYPTDTINLGSDRRSLFDVLKRGVSKGQIKEVYDDDYFKVKLTYAEILERLVSKDTLDLGFEQLNAGLPIDPQYINVRNITSKEIEQFKIKGTWYFDKRQGELKYRLLAIAPVAPDISTLDAEPKDQDLIPLFWIWFPDAREVLNNATVFNTRNSSQPITFDHMLNSRRFNAVIYKEENVYEDRQVQQYIFEDALQQLLESERIKSVIRDFEQDMWNN
ncbi:MAG: gliding motility protein GldN [Flavobacteriaceae bacterium]